MQDGKVIALQDYLLESVGPHCAIGEELDVEGIPAEVIGFRKKRVFSRLLGDPRGIAPGSAVKAGGRPLSLPVGPDLKGKVLDGLGRNAPEALERRALHSAASEPERIERSLATGVRAIDSLLALGAGQSLCLRSEPGVGKATTLGILVRNTSAHSVVLASVGELSTFMRDYLEGDLGQEGRARSVVVAATVERPPGERIKAPYTAMAVAEYLRDQGQDVLLIFDSMPRWRAAHQEMGLKPALEPLLARAGARAQGSITTIVTTDLAPENDLFGLTQGRCTLNRQVAHSGRYPAVDITQSVSQLFTQIASRQHQQGARWLRSILVHYQENQLLIESGAYKEGFNPRVDEAIRRYDECKRFLMQDVYERADFDDTVARLLRLQDTV